jgi:hypothetical protein
MRPGLTLLKQRQLLSEEEVFGRQRSPGSGSEQWYFREVDDNPKSCSEAAPKAARTIR